MYYLKRQNKSMHFHPYELLEVKCNITISDDMSWNCHIDSMTSKGNSKLGLLNRNLKVKDTKLKEKAYKAI